MNQELVSRSVHHVFMGLGSGPAGMSALASSFTDATLQKQWEQKLIPYTRLQPFGQNNPPRVTFSYLTFRDGSAAILRRVRKGDSPGRNNGHALVGSAAILGPHALRLTRTVDWAQTPEDMSREPYLINPINQHLIGRLDDTIPQLANVALHEECAGPGARLIARVLADPRGHVSFIGVSDKLTLSILTLFEDVLKPLFAVDPSIRTWSFSTYEVQDADPGIGFSLPEVIFLPGVPGGAGETRHKRIFFPSSPNLEDEYQQLATHLINEYHNLGQGHYRSKLTNELQSHDSIDSRIRYLIADKCHLPVSRRRAEFTQFEPAVEGAHPSPPSLGPLSSDNLISSVGIEPSQPPRKPVITPESTHSSDGDELIRKLQRDVPDRDNVNDIVTKLSQQGIGPDQKRWDNISAPAVLNVISNTFSLWERNTAYAKLLNYAFGSDLTVLQQKRYFDWVDECIARPDTDVYFGCTVFALVEGSPTESRCDNLLRQRWPEHTRISSAVSHGTGLWSRARRVKDNVGSLRFANRSLLIISILTFILGILFMLLLNGLFSQRDNTVDGNFGAAHTSHLQLFGFTGPSRSTS